MCISAIYHSNHLHTGWLREPEARPPFSEIVQRLDVFLQDPLRYVFTTQDGCVTNYDNLPSNLLHSGEFNYENHTFSSNTFTLSQEFTSSPLSPHIPHTPHTVTAVQRGSVPNPYSNLVNGLPSPNYEADPNMQQSFSEVSKCSQINCSPSL